MATPTTTIDALPLKTVPDLDDAFIVQDTGVTKRVPIAGLLEVIPTGPAGGPGPEGPEGPTGPPGVIIDALPPAETDVLWADTTTGSFITPEADTVRVFTYTDETATRPDATVVFWIPDPFDLPNPFGALTGDLVLRSTPDVISSTTGLTHIEHYTVSEYDAIATPDPDTVYLIVADP